MVIFAKELPVELVEKARVAAGRARELRRRKEDIFALFECEDGDVYWIDDLNVALTP